MFSDFALRNVLGVVASIFVFQWGVWFAVNAEIAFFGQGGQSGRLLVFVLPLIEKIVVGVIAGVVLALTLRSERISPWLIAFALPLVLMRLALTRIYHFDPENIMWITLDTALPLCAAAGMCIYLRKRIGTSAPNGAA